MTVHDWTRADGGLFHAFHSAWVIHLSEGLNAGILPDGYYARPEQHVGRLVVPDVLTLHAPERNGGRSSHGPPAGAVAVADAPPRVRATRRLRAGASPRPRTVAVRRAGDDDLVAVIEVVSPANKDREEHVFAFVGKVGALLRAGVHVSVIDLLPPTGHTPGGLHQAVVDEFGLPGDDEEAVQSADTPVALLAYESEMPDFQAYIDYLRVGDPLPDMPLFIAPGYYVRLPLGPTYEQTFRGLGRIDRDRITSPPATP